MNWDDLKLLLALVRAGNVRRAGAQAGVSHSTVARRVDQFERQLGVRLFDRRQSGYVLTSAGEEMFAVAERVEYELDVAERRVVGLDQKLAGRIRVTMVDVLATHLLMPDMQAFSARYPDIELEVLVSYQSADLDRGEADIAIRLTARPPETLIGRQLTSLAAAGYATPAYLAAHDLSDPGEACWIGFGNGERFPRWVRQSGYPHLPARGVFDSIAVQLAAVHAGMGLGYLPCFIGDRDPALKCVDEPANFPRYSLWLLRHADTRETARLRVFAEFMAAAIDRHRPLLEGSSGAATLLV